MCAGNGGYHRYMCSHNIESGGRGWKYPITLPYVFLQSALEISMFFQNFQRIFVAQCLRLLCDDIWVR